MTARPSPDAPKYDVLSGIIDWEQGKLDDAGTLLLFSTLIKTGTINGLQGCYGRTAAALIDAGVLSPTGDILGEASP